MRSDDEQRSRMVSFFRAFGWDGALLVVVAVVVGTAFARTPADTLTNRETLLWTLLLTGASVGASALVSRRFGLRTGREAAQQLARPALRRVLELEASAATIGEFVRSRREGIEESGETANAEEWLRAIGTLLVLHRGQLRAGVDDWSDLLPDDVASVMVSRRIQQLEAQIERERHEHAQAAQALRDRAADQEKELTAHQTRLKRLEKERQELLEEQERRRQYLDVGVSTALSPAPIATQRIEIADDGRVRIVTDEPTIKLPDDDKQS